MKKRLLSLLMAIILAVGVAPMFACNRNSSTDNIVKDEKTLNVKIYKAGYGTDYIEAFKAQFEKTFEEEGYKLNITAHDPFLLSEAVYRSVYSDSGIDIFFASSTTSEAGVAGKNYQNSFTDITESVYKKPAIKFDGTEESITIEEKLQNTGYLVENNVYNGKYYGLPYAFTSSGLNVNTRVLYDVFGYEELPRTTNELFEMADTIMSKYNQEFVSPFAFSLSGNNYLTSAITPWMAQLMGEDVLYDYLGFCDSEGNELRPKWKNGELVSGAYKVYDNPALEEAFTAMYQVVDWNTATSNVASQGFEAAQAQLLRGDGVFYFCGDYLYQEEKYRFEDKLDDINYIRTPVISKIGLDLFGEGTSYNYNAEKADKTLSIIVKYVDQNLSAEEIKTKAEQELGYALRMEDVEKVCHARGLFRSSGNPSQVHVSSKIPADKIPAMEAFLRFVASDDGGQMFADNALITSPWNMDALVGNESNYLNSVAQAVHNQHNVEFSLQNNRYKVKVAYSGMFPGLGEIWSVDFYSGVKKGGKEVVKGYVTKYDEDLNVIPAGNAVYREAGKAMAKYVYEFAYNAVKDRAWEADGDYPD